MGRTQAFGVHARRVGTAPMLLGGLTTPVNRLSVVLRDALAFVTDVAKSKLRPWNPFDATTPTGGSFVLSLFADCQAGL
jgi:hypothetical protein